MNRIRALLQNVWQAVCSCRTLARSAGPADLQHSNQLAYQTLEPRRLLAYDVSPAPILQWFESSHDTMIDRASDLFEAGYGAVWTPPPYRGDTSDYTVGYDVYDRFDLGQWNKPTLYGTEESLKEFNDILATAGKDLHVDYIMNHNGYSTYSTPGFVDAGGYPGLAITLPEDIDGDFHGFYWYGDEYERLAGLIDVAQEKNHQFIRHPVDPDDPQNIPAGTTPAFGRLANLPTEENRRFYPDIGHNTIYVYDPVTDESGIPIHSFNTADPTSGDPTVENAMGLMMRNAQWLVQTIGVDGLRIDAGKHMQGFTFDYFDRAVYRTHPETLLDGSPKHVFSYSETYDANPAVLLPHVKKTIDPNDIGTIGGNRDTLDYKWYFACKDNLENYGQSWAWNNIKDAGLDVAHNGMHDGSAGVKFVENHDVYKPWKLSNVAHALMLMLPGNATVYFNGGEFGEEREFPKGGRDDALSIDSITTRLIDIRETHGKGNYEERWVDSEGVYIFERTSNAVVGLSNRGDWGFDERTVEVGFAPGTLLVELTGNAENPEVDPYNDIPEVVTVWDGGDGKSYATIRVPRNLNTDGYEHQLGFVIYGLGTPQSPAGLELSGVDEVWEGNTSITSHYENGKTRQANIHLVTGDTLGVRLQTEEVRHLGVDELRDIWADGDYAMLKLDGGVDINQNGFVDIVTPGETTYGFEHFTDKASPLIGAEGISGERGDGEFLQSIDTTQLADGMHFLAARAFRHRTDGGPPVFTSWKESFYLDRVAPAMEIFESQLVNNVGDGDYDVVAKSVDHTADSVHIFANLPVTTSEVDIIAMASGGSGAATHVDTSHFKTFIPGLSTGNNVFTVVAFEPTGRTNVQRLSGNYLEGQGIGFGDLNFNGGYDVNDIDTFSWFMGNGGAEFSPAGDLSGDGVINYVDYELLGQHLSDESADASVMAAYNALANTAPNTAADDYVLMEDNTLVVDSASGVLNNDSDPDWQPLTTTLVSGPSHANTFSLNSDGSFTYQPNADFNGVDTFVYAADDQYGGVTQAAVTLTISGINDPPNPSEGSAYTRTDTAIDIDLSTLVIDIETSADDLIFQLDNPSSGTVSLLPDGRTAEFTPAAGFTGSASFTYTVTDTGDGDSSAIVVADTQVSIAVVPETPPTASLVAPLSGSVWPVASLASAGYLEVAFDDPDEGIDPSWITGDEITLSGDGVGTAVLSGSAADQGSGIYRYAFTGLFTPGMVTVDVMAGTFADLAGATASSTSGQFLVIANPPQSAGGNVSSPALLEWFETSWATMADRAADLFTAGYGGVWTPPPGRGIYTEAGGGIGYDVYDRFDLGVAGDPTLYGTETGYIQAIGALQSAGALVYADYLINHASSFDSTNGDTSGVLFAPDPNDSTALHGGGNPGFVHFTESDADGDFHPNPTATDEGDWMWEYQFQLAQLYDIDHRKTQSFIRQPVDTGDPLNIPMEGTDPFLLPEYDTATGQESLSPELRIANIPSDSNRQYYPDFTDFITVTDHVPGDTSTPESGVTLYNFTGNESTDGVPVAENANAFLMRYARWMIQYVGIDGFRVDAARHVYPFVHDYFDRAVFLAEQDTLLDGSAKHVFSFLESFTGDMSHLQTFISKDINPADLTTVGGNRDVLDMPLFFAFEDNLTNDGYNNNWHNIVNSSQDIYDDGLANNGSQTVAFVRSHDEEGAYLSNVAHAYMLSRPGNAAVYFNAREFNTDPTTDERPFPHDGTRDALGGHYGDAITRLMDIRNTHGRGDYLERWIDPTFSNYYAFEREGSMVVGLNSRYGGFGDWDARTIQTSFDEGTLLVELTGNSLNPIVDTNEGSEWEIPEVITVGADGYIELRVPQNKNAAHVEHGLGYVIYAPAGPQGTVSLTNVTSVLSGDSASAQNNPTNRLTDIQVISTDSFEVHLDTTAVQLLGDPALRDTAADGYFAALRLDAGLDLNGITGPVGNAASGVDYVTPGTLLYGFEDFTDVNAAGAYSVTGEGTFTQTVDATLLSEGRHYLTVRAFRTVPVGNEPIFTDFKKVILIDRATPSMQLNAFSNQSAGAIEANIIATDNTASSVTILLDLPYGLSDAEILVQADAALSSEQIDVNQFTSAFSGLSGGHHVLTIVATEESGRRGITRIAGQFVNGIGAGLGDIDIDGAYTPADILLLAAAYDSNNQTFHPAADVNGDGSLDTSDIEQLRSILVAASAPADTLLAYDTTFGTAPVYSGDTFATAENSSVGSIVGSLSAVDPEGFAITYSIVTNLDADLNGINAFEIDGGNLLILDASDLNFEDSPTLQIEIAAHDGAFTTTGLVTINLTDVNEAPLFADLALDVQENIQAFTILTTLSAMDPESQSLTYAIETNIDVDGDTAPAFSLSGGDLIVNDSGDFDYETQSQLTITVSASDGTNQTTASIIVNLIDANEFAPSFNNQALLLTENSVVDYPVGQLLADDLDGDSISFEIISAFDPDEDGFPAYRIDGDELRVNDTDDLNYESTPSVDLDVRASDGTFYTDAVITVNLEDINEQPQIDSQYFSMPENSVLDYQVGVLSAQDEDNDPLTFTILNNDDLDNDGVDTFRIAGDALLVNDADDIDFESGPLRNITVLASDGEYASTASIVIYLSDVDDAPVLSLPASQNINEDTDLILSSVNASLISIADADAQYTTTMWMQLEVQNGTLTLPDTTGLSFLSDNGSSSLIFTGYLTAMNEAIDGLVYRGSENYYGLDSLAMEVSDQSDAASGDPGNVTGQVAITINSVIEGPSFAVPGPIVLLQDSGQKLVQFTITVDSTIASDQIVLSAQSSDPSLMGAITTSMEGAGPYEGSISFQTSDGQSGSATITVTVEDGGLDGNLNTAGDNGLLTDTVDVIVRSAPVIIMNNGDGGFSQTGFAYQNNAQTAAAYDGDNHHMQGGSGSASWAFDSLTPGLYRVAAMWAHKYNNNYNATDAPFTIEEGTGTVLSSQIVDQTNTPDDFESLGYFWHTLDTINIGESDLVVTLGAGSLANRSVVADAIHLQKIPALTLDIAESAINENGGTTASSVMITRDTDLSSDLVVSLASGDATEASVPATVTIPAGQASTTFNIDAVDDVFFDGTQTVTFSATAAAYNDGSDSLEILDDETAHTALIDDGEAGFAQSGFTYQNNAHVAAAYNGDNYWLRNGDDADQASWTFTGLDDGAYHVMATWAHKYNNNYNALDAPFQILDAGGNVLSSVEINQKNAPSEHEVGGTFWDTLDTVYVAGGQLTVTLGASAQANKFVVADAVRIEQLVQPSSTLVVQLGEEIVDEDAGTVSGIVSRGAETVGDLVVTLNSDATAVGTVPATVTIPDGAGAVPFTLTVVDDAVVDGDQQVAVTATAAGYIDGTDSLLVEDDEFPPVQIIDNGDAGFTETGGFKERTWAGAYEGDNHYMRGSDGEARWQFTDLIDGEYTVSVTWDHISDNRYNATDAPFTIRDGSGDTLAQATVDQTLSPADFSDGVTDWHTLGTVYVIDGELTVSLTEALVNKYVVADAVRIEIDTNPTSKLLVILDASSVSEAGTLNGKVIRTGDPAGSLTVNLASDNAAAATVPATITLGEGARYGTFAITPTDDSAPDGTQITNIGATAEGFTAGTAALDVTDDDATILFVDNGEDGFVADAGFKRRNVAGAYQNDNHSMRGGTGEASWTFTGLEEGQYFVSATWNHIYENRYNTEKAPFSITNGSGNLLATTIVDQTQTPADFTDGGYGWEALAPVYINDGTLIVTLGASPTNHHAVADAIRIELNESLAPSLFVLVDTLSESAGASTGTVVRTGDVSSEATVGLTSSNSAAATVESSITFAIGESTKSFVITPTDDSSPDGIQQSTIEATAASYAAGTAVLNVQDDDALEVAIMDNTDNGYTSNGFRYNANKQVSDAYGGNNESLKGGEPGEAASWTFTGLTDGVYHVSATWNHQYNNNYNAHDAQYSITNAGDEALATTTINQSNAPSEFLDNGIAWGTLDTVTVTGGELVVTVSGGSNPNRHTVADAVRIARVAELGGSSMRMAETDPFYNPLGELLEDTLDDLDSTGDSLDETATDAVFSALGGL